MKWFKRIICMIIFIVFITSVCKAVDLSSCTDALDSIRRAASNASDAANEAENKEQELEEAKDKLEDAEDELENARNELENCLLFPDIYDLLDDGCQSYRWDYESAKSNYKYAITNLVL